MFNQFYLFTVQNLVFGGVAILLILGMLFWDARKVARSNDKGRMFAWMAAPAIMVIGAVLLTVFAFNTTSGKLYGLMTSEPVQNAVTMGDGITKGIDALIAQSGVDLSQFTPTDIGGSGFSVPSGGAPSFGGSGVQQGPSTGNPLVLPTVAPTPGPTAAPGVAPSNQMQASTAPANGGAVQYVVQPGDSMYKIAQKMLGNGNLVADLCAANGMNMAQCGTIRRGQVIKLTFDGSTPPRERPVIAQQSSGQQVFAQQQARYNPAVTNKFVAPVATTAANKSYTIQAGDNIFKIATKQAGGLAAVSAICQANRQTLGDNCDQLQPGATIVIP